jgi:hypothetical protein
MDQSNPRIIVSIDEPTNRSGTTSSRVLVRGWALNPASQRGTGVSRVDLYLDAGPDQGGMYLGRASYGSARPDVVDAMDGSQRFLNSGWELSVDVPRGPHTLIAIAAPSGGGEAVVTPGVAQIQATVGGMAGRTVAGCAAGGYCSSMEGGLAGHINPGFTLDPLYAGNTYVGYGTFGDGATTPPYGWWDALLPSMMPYLMNYAAAAYPNPQWFYGSLPNLYGQNLLSTLATQGVFGTTGGCAGPAFGGLGILGLTQLGGYSFGFPQIGPTSTLGGGGLGSFGQPNQVFGTAGASAIGVPLGVPFAGSVPIGWGFGSGLSGAFNGGLSTIAGSFGGRVAGPGGVGGAISSAYGGINPGFWGTEIGTTSACIERL